MKKERLLFLFLIFLIIPITSAIETTLEVRTSADYGVVVRILDPNSKEIIDSVYGTADNAGIAKIVFESSRSELAFTIMTVYNDEVVKTEQTETFPTGGIIAINMDDSIPLSNIAETQTEEKVEESVPATTEVIQETTNEETIQDSSDQITGNAINLESVKSSYKYAIYIAIILVGSVFFIFLSRRFKKSKEENSIVDDIKANREKRKLSLLQELEDAESKIQEARRELDNIKDYERKRAERKLEKLNKLNSNQSLQPQNTQNQINQNPNSENRDNFNL